MKRTAWASALFTMVFASLAQAAPGRVQRVAVVGMDFQGGIPDAGRQLFGTRLAEGLTAAEFEVLAGAQVTRDLAGQGGSSCRATSCYPAVASTLAVSFLIVASVVEQNKTYDIAVQLINGRTGALIATDRSRCETCGIEEAGEKMGLAASALRARLEAITRQPARFVISSTPGAARAAIDGKAVGRTPVDVEVAGGEHRLTLSLAGYQRMERTFTAVSGVDETLQFTLTHEPSTFPYRVVAFTSFAAAAVAVAAGIWAVTVDGDELSCAPAKQDDLGHCPYVRDTAAIGATLVGVGALLGSIGGISLYMSSRDAEPDDETPKAASSYGLTYRGQF